MPVVDLLDLPAALPARTPVLGLDPGEKTIGVAVSDLTLSIASPLALIRRRKFTEEAEELFALMAGRGAGGMVIGLPVNMDGTEGSRCQSNRALGRNLLRLRPELVIAFWDERLSTAAVERMLIGEADLTRARRAEVVDRAAAAYILQGALDRLRLEAERRSP
jgi:putative Holliday junction resolvase